MLTPSYGETGRMFHQIFRTLSFNLMTNPTLMGSVNAITN